MPQETDTTSTSTENRQGETVVLLTALLVVAPVSSALIMWTILPALAGWIWPMISL